MFAGVKPRTLVRNAQKRKTFLARRKIIIFRAFQFTKIQRIFVIYCLYTFKKNGPARTRTGGQRLSYSPQRTVRALSYAARATLYTACGAGSR